MNITPIIEAKNAVLQFMKNLEGDPTALTADDLIQLKMAADLVQNAGIEANHAVSRMHQKWMEKHHPEEVAAYKQYCIEQNARACAPNPLLADKPLGWRSGDPDPWLAAYKGTSAEHAAVLNDIDQTP